jgi:hypothetical protein
MTATGGRQTETTISGGDSFVIRYRYPGSAGGTPVGLVYAQEQRALGPSVWSYTKDPGKATAFGTAEEAEATIAPRRRRGSWPEATVIALADAEPLP